jgi:hypothetical protein
MFIKTFIGDMDNSFISGKNGCFFHADSATLLGDSF